MKAVALDLDGFTGGGQTAIGDLADAVRRGARGGQAGGRLRRRLYRRQLPARLGGVGNLAQSARRGADRRARADRTFITRACSTSSASPPTSIASAPTSRRSSRSSATTCRPRRSRITWRSTRRRSKAGGRASSRRGPRPMSTCSSSDMNGAVAAAGGDMAKAALAGGLVDKIGDRPRFEARLAELGGDDEADGDVGFARIKLASYVADVVDAEAERADRRRHHRRHDRRRQGRAREPPAATRSPRRSRTAVRDKGIKALVVRVDSPGGSVLASERIRQALLDAKAKRIPVVVSMGSVAASGGYWVSTPGRLHLRRALDHHRLDRRVRRHPELPGHAAEARDRRRRGEDDAAVGRARSASRAPRPKPTS